MAILPLARLALASAYTEHASPAADGVHVVPTSAPPNDERSSEHLASHALASASVGSIVARLIDNGRQIELRTCALMTAESGGTVAPAVFELPEPLIPSLAIAHSHAGEGELVVVAVAESGRLYRLAFRGPDYFAARPLEDYADEHVVPSLAGRRPVLLHAVDGEIVLIACADGSMVHVERSAAGRWIDKDMRSGSYIGSFFGRQTLTAGSLAAPTQALSVASFHGHGLNRAYSVTRDSKLKIWHTIDGRSLRTLELPRPSSSALVLASDAEAAPRGSTALLAAHPRVLIRGALAVDDPSYSAYLVVFQPWTAQFLIYGVAESDRDNVADPYPIGEFAAPASLVGAGADLRDFEISQIDPRRRPTDTTTADLPYMLWTLWDRAGEPVVAYGELPGEDTPADEVGSWTLIEPHGHAVWGAEYFDQLVRSSTGERGIPDTFAEHVFAPGRYSTSAIEHALRSYTSAVLHETQAGDRPEALHGDASASLALPVRARAVVGCTVRLTTSADMGAPLYDVYERELANEWMRFVAMCNEARTAARYPLQLAIDPISSAVVVVGRDVLASPIALDALSAIVVSDPGAIVAAPELTIERTYPKLVDATTRTDIVGLLGSLESLARHLGPELLGRFESALIDRLVAPAVAPVVDLAEDVYDAVVTDEDAGTPSGALQSLQSLTAPDEAIQTLASLLSTPDTLAELAVSADGSASDLVLAWIASATTPTIDVRFDVALRLATLLVHAVVAEDEEGAVDVNWSRALSLALTALHGLHALRWLDRQPVPVDLFGESSDVLERFGGLSFGERSSGATPPSTVLGAIFRSMADHAQQPLSDQLGVPFALGSLMGEMWRKTGALGPDAEVIATTAGHVHLAYQLVRLDLASVAVGYVQLWPSTVGLEYVLALAFLALDRHDDANQAFEKAAVGLCA